MAASDHLNNDQTGRVLLPGHFGGILDGPQSHPWADTGEDWLDERENAGNVDAALNADERQRHMAEVGEPQWITGEADTAPKMEGDRVAWQRKTGISKHLDQQRRSGPRERLGLQFNVVDEDDRSLIPGATVIGQEPLSHVYRGMSEEEFTHSQERGFIQSDERGVIQPGWEGTNASPDYGSAHSYLPPSGPGRIVKIAVHPDDQWFTSDIGDYPRTRAPIPWERVIAHTSTIDKSKYSKLREQVVTEQKAKRDGG